MRIHRFRDLPIRLKVQLVIMGATSAALLIAGGLLTVFQSLTEQRAIAGKMQVLADIIAVYARAPLDFDDADAAMELLRPLREDPKIVTSGILTADNRLLARVARDGAKPPPDVHVPLDEAAPLFVAEVRGDDGRRLGLVYIQANMRDEILRNQMNSAGLVVLTLMAAWLAALLLSLRMHRVITRPILSLRHTAAAISRDRDYALRAPREANDEIGQLIEQFNAMLGQIQARDSALRESEEQYRSLYLNAMVGICRLTHEAPPRFLQVNPAAARIFGYDSAEDMAMHADIGTITAEPYTWQHILDSASKTGMAANLELPMRRKDGTAIWVALNAVAFRGEDGTPRWIDVVVNDITARKAAERELKEHRDHLELLVQRRTAELQESNKRLQQEARVREKAEAALRENLSFLQTLIDAIPSPVFFKDTQGVYLGCNAAFERMIGRSKSEIVGNTAHDIAPATFADVYRGKDLELLQSSGRQTYESVVRFADGEDHPVVFYKGAFNRSDGTLGGLIGTVLDITERKRGEQRIARLNECLLSFGTHPIENIERLTALSGSILNAASAFYFHRIGSEIRQAATWSAGDFEGTPEVQVTLARDVVRREEEGFVCLHGEDGSAAAPASRLLAQGGYGCFAAWPVRAHGITVGCLSLLYRQDRNFDIEDEKLLGVLAGAIAIEEHRRHAEVEREEFLKVIVEYSDDLEKEVAERLRAERKLQRFADKLEQTNEELKNFAYIVSHDLRAPLVNLKGFVGELRISLDELKPLIDRARTYLTEADRASLSHILDADVHEALQFVESSATRMDRLLSAILKLSRMGRRELHFEPVNMYELAHAVVKSLTHQIEQRHVTVNIAPLPTIVADYTAMDQIVGNLLDNAVKYLDPARPGVIEVHYEDLGNFHAFSVSDNGRGIAKAELEKVFDIFKRCGIQDVPGEGMGLAYVRSMVRRHRGEIHCESELGRGSTFTFTITKDLDAEAAGGDSMAG